MPRRSQVSASDCQRKSLSDRNVLSIAMSSISAFAKSRLGIPESLTLLISSSEAPAAPKRLGAVT